MLVSGRLLVSGFIFYCKFFRDTQSLARKNPNFLLSVKFKHSQNIRLYATNSKNCKKCSSHFSSLKFSPTRATPDMSSTNLQPMVSDTPKTYQFGEVPSRVWRCLAAWHGRKDGRTCKKPPWETGLKLMDFAMAKKTAFKKQTAKHRSKVKFSHLITSPLIYHHPSIINKGNFMEIYRVPTQFHPPLK